MANELKKYVCGCTAFGTAPLPEQCGEHPPHRDPIPLNREQLATIQAWADDTRLWDSRDSAEFNLHTFARKILALASASASPQQDLDVFVAAIRTLREQCRVDSHCEASGARYRLIKHNFMTRLDEALRIVDEQPASASPGSGERETGLRGLACEKSRYRFEREAMKIVEGIKHYLLPAMEVEEGGWILGQILDLAELIQKSALPASEGQEPPAQKEVK